MNCDEAFDWLTDPLRRHRAELRWHLDLCPRCRQMEEVLSPALELFDDDRPATAPAAHLDGVDEPAAGNVSPDTLQLAELTAARLRRAAPNAAAPPASRTAHWVRYAAAFVAGATLALGAFRLTTNGDPSSSAIAPVESAECTWQTRARVADERRLDADAVVTSCLACHRAEWLR